jgi:hypothetical protein
MSSAPRERLYSIQEVSGKGRGWIATTTITKGTRILSESPLFQVPRYFDAITKGVAALSKEQLMNFLSLHNSFEDTYGPLVGRFLTNGLPLRNDDPDKGGIFLDASRINHSCNHNAHHTWEEAPQQLTVHTIKDIAKGEEITICYLGERQKGSRRREVLAKAFRISCSCSHCSLPPDQRKGSDERWDEIQKIDDSIRNGLGFRLSPLQSLHDAHRLLNLLDEEDFAGACLPGAYNQAFNIAIMHGDVARARVFAERAVSTAITLSDNDCPDVQILTGLAKNLCQRE